MKTQDFDLIVSKMLRYGVFVVSGLLAVGWITSISFSENVFLKYGQYKESHLLNELNLAWSGNEWGLLLSYLGLAVLISLPLIRVVMAGVLFAKQKEYRMMGICLLVLFGLALSVGMGAIK